MFNVLEHLQKMFVCVINYIMSDMNSSSLTSLRNAVC